MAARLHGLLLLPVAPRALKPPAASSQSKAIPVPLEARCVAHGRRMKRLCAMLHAYPTSTATTAESPPAPAALEDAAAAFHCRRKTRCRSFARQTRFPAGPPSGGRSENGVVACWRGGVLERWSVGALC